MFLQYIILVLVTAVSAVPLNINLGAYSPALVVGDGEISFDSTQKAAELMETLASGAVPPAQNENPGEAATPSPAPEAARATPEGDVDVPAPNLTRRDDEVDNLVAEVTQWIKRDIEGFREALNFAREAMKNQPKVELGTGKEGSGVGVIVNPGLNVPAGSAANGAPSPGGAAKAKGKRSEVVEDTSESKGKMTLVAITEV